MTGTEVAVCAGALCGSQLYFTGFLAVPLGLALVAFLIDPSLEKKYLGAVPSFDLTTMAGVNGAWSALQGLFFSSDNAATSAEMEAKPNTAPKEQEEKPAPSPLRSPP